MANLKHLVDTDANWIVKGQTENYIPEANLVIYYATSAKFKIGDGVTNINNLPFIAEEQATDSSEALMTIADKYKLDTVEEKANYYTLPAATSATLGGVKVDGKTISVHNGIISAKFDYEIIPDDEVQYIILNGNQEGETTDG